MSKTLKYIAFVIISYFLLLSSTYAASLSLSRSASSVSLNSTVKVTAKISGATNYTYSEFTLSYDQEKFSFVSSSDSCNGLYCLVEVNGSITFTFKAKMEGSATFNASGTFEDDSSGSLASSTKITVTSKSDNTTSVTDKTNLSSNNYLSSLIVEGYELTPEFNKDTTEYTLNLASDISSISIGATAEDNNATIIGTGNQEVSEGINTIEITVTAENGNKKTYVIKANVEEKDPISITIDKDKYTVVRNKDLLTKPENYEEKTITIDSKEVPAFYSEITNFTLVGLKDSDGEIALYIYNEKDNSYTLYQELSFNSIRIYPINTNKIPKGYQKYTIDMNGTKVKGFKIADDSSYAIIYGMDVDTGKKNYYMYDSENNTLQIYNDEHVNLLYKEQKIYSYIILCSWACIVLFLIIIIVLCIKNSKRKKKIRNILNKISGNKIDDSPELVNGEEIVDELVEQNQDDEMYDIFEDNKKKRK